MNSTLARYFTRYIRIGITQVVLLWKFLFVHILRICFPPNRCTGAKTQDASRTQASACVFSSLKTSRPKFTSAFRFRKQQCTLPHLRCSQVNILERSGNFTKQNFYDAQKTQNVLLSCV